MPRCPRRVTRWRAVRRAGVNFEIFRPVLDAVLMFRTPMLQAIDSRLDEQTEIQVRDRSQAVPAAVHAVRAPWPAPGGARCQDDLALLRSAQASRCHRGAAPPL
jgi:hypothetical protein